MRNIIALIAISFLSACQSYLPGTLWVVTITKDEFTDSVTQMVTIGEGLSKNIVITHSLKLYPFVSMNNGELYLGIRSGGRFSIPTGTVQIRIDDNTAWTITPDETPTYLLPSTPAFPMPHLTGQTAVAEEMQTKMMENLTKTLSPFTATSGEKAKTILKEMISGDVIKCRTVGMNQATSITGEVYIDDSFLSALQKIGIEPNSI